MLAVGASLFETDAQRLVLQPIERMTEKVSILAANPFANEDAVQGRSVLGNANQKEVQKNLETYILEKAIVKITHLLALGFGEAGGKIIHENMEMGGNLNPMFPGTMVVAIFGFCDIRQFTNATEILQTRVMTFVNTIAEIVHSDVDRFGGTANKNIGDAFLLVWKFKDDQVVTRRRAVNRSYQQRSFMSDDEEEDESEPSQNQEGEFEEMLDVNRKSKMVNNIAD